jgi:predicted RNA-binding Zn-ribbon protein involved in translation (DUF1610 family)
MDESDLLLKLKMTLTTRCSACGSEIPPWFDPHQFIYGLDEDDAAFEEWLNTPCPNCGRTPRQVLRLGGAKEKQPPE